MCPTNSDVPDRASHLCCGNESEMKANRGGNESDMKVWLNWDIATRSRMKARRFWSLTRRG